MRPEGPLAALLRRLFVSLVLLACSTVATAQDRGARGEDAGFKLTDEYVPAPRDRLYYTNATIARYNPLGGANTLQVGWRRRLSTKDSLLTRDTYAFVGGSVILTPAYARVGPYAEAQLLSVLRVFTTVAGLQYFGTFDQVISFDDPSVNYSDATLGQLSDAGGAQAVGGWAFLAGFTLRAAAGPIAVRTTGNLQQITLSFPEDKDEVFYDLVSDRLVPNGGFTWVQDTDLLYLRGKARVGARHTFTDNLDGSVGDGGLAHHRVGPILAYQFADKRPGARFNQPTVFVLTQWWAQHPYRTGAEQPGGLPLIALGFAFNGDFATSAIPQPTQQP